MMIIGGGGKGDNDLTVYRKRDRERESREGCQREGRWNNFKILIK